MTFSLTMRSEDNKGHFSTTMTLTAESVLVFVSQPDVVVNCAALSVPRACEVDPAAAMAVNVPSSLVKWLLSFKNNSTLLIHLSTDQGVWLSFVTWNYLI